MRIAILSYERASKSYTKAIRVGEEIEDIAQLPEITSELLKLAGIDADLFENNGDDEADWISLFDAEDLPALGGDVLTQCRFEVPTYYGHDYESVRKAGKAEFDFPNVRILVHEAEGVRLILGTADRKNLDCPNVQVERRPNGWAIFLNANGGDTIGVVYLYEGKCAFVHECFCCNEGRMITAEDIPVEVDRIPERDGT